MDANATNATALPLLAADEAASPVAFIVFLLVVLVGLPLLFCADAKRKMAPAFGVGEHVLVRRGGNRLNKKHLAQITAVHRERRPVLLTGGLYADDRVALWCLVDAATCGHLKPRAYDVQYEEGGQERAPELWLSALPATAPTPAFAAVEGGGVVGLEAVEVAMAVGDGEPKPPGVEALVPAAAKPSPPSQSGAGP